MSDYFFDTYAFIEILKGNPNYKRFNNNVVVTTKMNLMELHHTLLRTSGRKYADKQYFRMLRQTIHVEDKDYIRASILRTILKRRSVSYIDCIGYIIAKGLDIPFLTGDTAFENMKNVAFVL